MYSFVRTAPRTRCKALQDAFYASEERAPHLSLAFLPSLPARSRSLSAAKDPPEAPYGSSLIAWTDFEHRCCNDSVAALCLATLLASLRVAAAHRWSKECENTTMEAARPGSPVHFDDATLNFVKGGPPPPPSETSTRLQSRCHDMFRRRTEEARTKQAPRAMSTLEALGAAKISLGEDAVAAAFGDEEAYLASIRNEPTITGTAPRLWHIGPRAYAARSPHAQAIQALDAQQAGAAILPAPGGVVALEGVDDARQWAHLALIPSTAKRDGDLNYWEGIVNSGAKPFQILWAGGNWSGDEVTPKWDDLIKSPSGRKPPENTEGFYRGPLARGVTRYDRMTKGACEGDARMLEHWARAAFYARRLAAILEKESKAFEDMCAKSEAMGNGSGRPRRRVPRRSHNPMDVYADLTRAETDRLIEEHPKKWHQRHTHAFRGQLARREDVLNAIATELGVPRCVLTAEKGYLISPAIRANLPVPGLGTDLVKGNYDHEDKGWDDDPSVAIRKLGFRRLMWGKLNKKSPGYEHLIKDENAAERVYLEGYLNSTLYCDPSFGKQFVFEIEIDDESKFWGMKTKDQQAWELHRIKNHFLKGAILGATEGRADAAWNSST